jgi:hypothetical protein
MNNEIGYYPIETEDRLTNIHHEPAIECQQWIPSTGISPRMRCESYLFDNIFIKPFVQFEYKKKNNLKQLSLEFHFSPKKENRENELWKILFPDDPMIIPYCGAVNVFSGKLRKLISDDDAVNIEEDIKNSKEEF